MADVTSMDDPLAMNNGGVVSAVLRNGGVVSAVLRDITSTVLRYRASRWRCARVSDHESATDGRRGDGGPTFVCSCGSGSNLVSAASGGALNRSGTRRRSGCALSASTLLVEVDAASRSTRSTEMSIVDGVESLGVICFFLAGCYSCPNR